MLRTVRFWWNRFGSLFAAEVNRAILAAAEERNADLIVIASHRPGLQQFLLGSTASRVVRHATCTVFVKR